MKYVIGSLLLLHKYSLDFLVSVTRNSSVFTDITRTNSLRQLLS